MNRAALIGAAVLVLIVCAFAQSSVKKPLAFKIMVMSDGIEGHATAAGFQSPHFGHVHFGRNGYEASDGQRLSAKYVQLRDDDEAQRYFEWSIQRWSIQRVAQVTKKGEKRDKKGKTVGLRAEVVPKSPNSGCAVMWTDGAMFREIVGEDCVHARALERQYVP